MSLIGLVLIWINKYLEQVRSIRKTLFDVSGGSRRRANASLVITSQSFGNSRRRQGLDRSGRSALMGTARPESFRTIPSATGGITRLACAKLREQGKDVARILTRAGLIAETVDDPAARLEARAQIKLLELAAEELDDELFGFHLARHFDLREIGLVYYVIASSQHLADALRNAERYSLIVNEGVRLHCSLGEGAAITLDYVGVERRLDRHHIEFWLVTLVRICREVTSSRLAPRRLKVRHLRPDPPADFKSFFGTEVEFGSDIDEIVLSAPVASLPTARHDAHLNRLLRQYAEEALTLRPTRPASTVSEVEKLLPELLPHGRADLSEAAHRLGISSRTLSRKLHEEGATFSEILDELRKALAKRYLGERELQVSEIAWLLGYCEVSSFTHAFKRWTGITPRQFR
jgi:AraC-like DNA-binding protein